MRFWLILISICFSVNLVSAQEQFKIDSLKVLLDKAATDSLRIDVLNKLSDTYSKVNFLESLEYSKQALTIAEKSNSKILLARAYSNVANGLFFIGIYDEALDYFLRSLRIADEIDAEILKLQLYHNIGVIKDRLSLFDEALDYYFKALSVSESNKELINDVNAKKLYPIIYNSIGNIYSTKKDFKSSKEYYIKGYNIAKGSDDESFGVLSNNLGKYELEQGNSEKALFYLMQSLEFRERINDMHGLSKTYLNLSSYYQSLNQIDKAIEYAHKALDLSERTKALAITSDAAEQLSGLYDITSNCTNSLKYFKKYKELSDSLMNEKKYSEIVRLQLQYKYEIANKEQEAKKERLFYRTVVLLSTLTLGLIILGLLYILSRNRNKRIQMEKSQLEKDMDLKNKELTTNVMYLIKKNELIDGVTNRLLLLKSKLKEENKDSLQRIIFDLQAITEKEVWEEFELRFQSVHEDFYRNLKLKFPDLSPAEIKLAAFLRLNMTSKDIASITGQSINSLETARYRLRKKLGITNQEVNLVTFLQDL